MRCHTRFFPILLTAVLMAACSTVRAPKEEAIGTAEPPAGVESAAADQTTSASVSNNGQPRLTAPEVLDASDSDIPNPPGEAGGFDIRTSVLAEPDAEELIRAETASEYSLDDPFLSTIPDSGSASLETSLSLPPAPKRNPLSTIEVEVSSPTPRPSASTLFRYALPEAPVSSQSKPAPVPQSGKSGPQSMSERALQPASSTPSAQTPGRQPLPPAFGRLREIYAREGDEVRIGLDGPGFLFLGFPDNFPQPAGISFKGKETKSGKSTFTFKALRLGVYDLDFLQQDNTAGATTRETVRVHVVSDLEFASEVEGKASRSGAEGQPESADPEYAEKLARLGANEAAIAELLKGYRNGDYRTNDRLASLYMLSSDYDAAEKYYLKNLAAANAFADRAVMGLFRIAIVRSDQKGILSRLKQFLALNDPAAEELCIQAARVESAMRQIGIGLELASEYAKRYPEGKWRAEADFIAAQLLESDSPFRDIARARGLYQGILNGFPVSAFANPARERLQYIERHFFQVR